MGRNLLKNPSKHTLYCRELAKKPKWVEYREKHKIYLRKWRKENRSKFKEGQQRSIEKTKLEVFSHYSKGKPRCACCGEDGMRFLTVDHIDGNGAEHRRTIARGRKVKGMSGSGRVWWLKQNGFPKGFQILCANCNFSKRTNKYCPHQTGDENLRIQMTINCFCANCQKETDHAVSINVRSTAELILACPCTREIKAPKGTPDELKAWLAAHKDANVGHVKLDMDDVNRENQAYLESLKSAGIGS